MNVSWTRRHSANNQDKIKVGRRVIKSALATTPHEAFIHRYQLQLLLLQTLEDSQSNDFFSAAEDLIVSSHQRIELMSRGKPAPTATRSLSNSATWHICVRSSCSGSGTASRLR